LNEVNKMLEKILKIGLTTAVLGIGALTYSACGVNSFEGDGQIDIGYSTIDAGYVQDVSGNDNVVVCSDKDMDGFADNAGCGTQVDCNDRDAEINPGKAELPDGVDNNCDGQIDDDFSVRYDDFDDHPENFQTGPCSFDHTPITYAFDNFTPDMNGVDVQASFSRAFSLWENQTSLRFEEIASVGEADIVILFDTFGHTWSDGNACFPFDGPYDVLAHAYHPCYSSPITEGHFDDSEDWTDDIRNSVYQPIDMDTVAAHEIGHMLGLHHSDVDTALMAPLYVGSHRYLDQDDVDGIQALYPGDLPPPCNDDDGDGYGNPGIYSCRLGEQDDCDDSNVAIHPNADELCDLLDNDCNGLVDEDPDNWSSDCGSCLDTDGDGYGELGSNLSSCLYPNQVDCNNDNADMYPGAPEFCDAKDNNCNGEIDEDPGFYNNCGSCGPDELGIGDTCGECGSVQCRNGGGVECNDPCECPGHPEMIRKGDYCIDKWENSVWSSSQCNGRQWGLGRDDWLGEFPVNVHSRGLVRGGNTHWPSYCCIDAGVMLYACSKAGVIPAYQVTWFRARKACENSDKRLCTREEWVDGCDGQVGDGGCEYGTNSCDSLPDGVCNLQDGLGQIAPTGSFQGCRSAGGAFDMTGNLSEVFEDHFIQHGNKYRNYCTSTGYDWPFDQNHIHDCSTEGESCRSDAGMVENHRGFRCCVDL